MFPISVLLKMNMYCVSFTVKFLTLLYLSYQFVHLVDDFVIQIKICAEYLGKQADALGTMPRYSAQILIRFITSIFQLFSSSVVWMGNLVFQDCLLTMPSVHFYQNEAVTKGKQISKHPLHKLAETLWHLCHRTDYTDKVENIHISWKFFNLRTKLMESFFIPISNFTLFQSRIQTDFSSLELGQQRLLWWLIRSRIWQQSLSCQTWLWKYFLDNYAWKWWNMR